MKYLLIRSDGVVEIRQDDYPLPNEAIQLNDDQYSQLLSGDFIWENGQIIANLNIKQIGIS
jgi:hypothetical protein